MGIPSYYKRLIDRFPRLVSKGLTAIGARKGNVLLMDFNCLIYQCVRGEGMPAYTAETRETWEAALLEAVKAYTVKVWDVAGRPAEVFIGVDGVVPMAKIRQQRLRRFKSPWLAAQERAAGIREGESWDTNAITPGTEFIEKLGRALKGLAAARGAGWSVSAADEPGEGEQKLMDWIRVRGAAGLAGKEVIVYGLDADLIVLSLLALARDAAGVAGWRLLRELAEFEGARAGDPAAFGCLDVRELLGLLVPDGIPAAEYMLEYCCGMSFLGNDFLPHSLSVKMREGGHDRLCRTLTALHTAGGRLVDAATGQIRPDGCAALAAAWSKTEEEDIAHGFKEKYRGRGPPPRSDKERAMLPVQNLPLTWKQESALWMSGSGIEGAPTLVDGWRDLYYARWMREAAPATAAAEYVRGLQWIVDYYLGRPVSYSWYFPWSLPPLWSDVAAALESVDAVAAPAVTSPVAPQEQLAMVLPASSWWLVRRADLRALPARAPAFWPEKFGFFSVGRRWMWECEAEVPIMSMERLRGLLRG
jgi:5'-3' exonuclease